MELADTVSEERQQIVQHDRLALFAGSAGIFLSTLDSGIMNVALPSLCTAFACDFHAITLASPFIWQRSAQRSFFLDAWPIA
jgi:hypothetical protein